MSLYVGTIGSITEQKSMEIAQKVLEIGPFNKIFCEMRNYKIPPIPYREIYFVKYRQALTLEELIVSSCLLENSVEKLKFKENERLLVFAEPVLFFRKPESGIHIEDLKSLDPADLNNYLNRKELEILHKNENFMYFVTKNWSFSRGISSELARIAVVECYNGIPDDVVETSAHELGHTFGLPHHSDKICIMNEANSLPKYFCGDCLQKILSYKPELSDIEIEKVWLESYLYSRDCFRM
jgi:hypothetical protein